MTSHPESIGCFPLQLHIVLLVLLAAALHAGWNALVKSGQDRVLTMALVIGSGAAASGLALPFVALPARESWVFLLLSTLIHVGYFFFLLQAYRVGDLSHVYPVARGTAPLLVALGAALFAGEALSAAQLGGLLLVSLALGSLAFEPRGVGRRDLRPFLFGLGTAAFIGAYTVTDGMGVRLAGGPLSFILWHFFLDGIPLTLYALIARRGQIGPYLRAHWKPGLAGGAMCALAYGVVIWALNLGPMATVSALRETSVIFAAVIGSLALRESFGLRRLTVAALVAAGLAVMNLAG